MTAPPETELVRDPAAAEPDPTADLRATLLSAIRTLRIATLALGLVLVGFGVYVYLEARETHDALCVFRGDLESRVDQTKDFLVDHPNGFAGIPANVLRQSLRNQELTIKALANLSCPPRRG